MTHQRILLVRHGPTAWSLSGQHTGRTDIPLTPDGRRVAERLAQRLVDEGIAQAFTSPLVRARETATLAGFGNARPLPALMEWDYGEYEGLTRPQIQERRPGWDLFRDGVPKGETLAEVAGRAKEALAIALREPGDVVLFAHGHLLRVLAAVAVGLPAETAERLLLGPAAVSVLLFDENGGDLELWNDQSHLEDSA